MRHDHATGDASKVTTQPDYIDNLACDQLAADALAALKEVDAHGAAGLPLLLRFGEALFNAKMALKHGEFSPWCREVLKRSPSWCSTFRRLYENRADLEPAVAWAAATDHRWANCRSIERLLKIIAEWKKANRGDCATTPRPRRKKAVPVALLELEAIAAQLRQILAEAEEAFETVRYELWLTVPPDDGSAKAELVELGRRIRSRLRELVETCSSLQLSNPPAKAASDRLPPDMVCN